VNDVRGVIVRFNWVNPHAYVYETVDDASGKIPTLADWL
jgi:hypothetical protein